MAEAKPAGAAAARKKVTIPMLMDKMKKGEPIVQLAVYDYETAIIADRVGIDILCVSDTGGMVLFGHESTTSVSFEEVMFMAQAVKRGSRYGLRMVDMPYMSFHLSAQQAVDNAAKYVSQGGAEVMKCEGNQHHAKYIEAIVRAGIPVQGHIGITPMRMPQLGGFFAQGKTAERAKELIDDAWAMVDAGCFSIMCEVTTSEVCEHLAATLEDLRRPRADHRERPLRLPRRRARAPLSRPGAHRVHEGRRARALQADDGRRQAQVAELRPYRGGRRARRAADRHRWRRRGADDRLPRALRRPLDPPGRGDLALHLPLHRHPRYLALPAPRQHRPDHRRGRHLRPGSLEDQPAVRERPRLARPGAARLGRRRLGLRLGLLGRGWPALLRADHGDPALCPAHRGRHQPGAADHRRDLRLTRQPAPRVYRSSHRRSRHRVRACWP